MSTTSRPARAALAASLSLLVLVGCDTEPMARTSLDGSLSADGHVTSTDAGTLPSDDAGSGDDAGPTPTVDAGSTLDAGPPPDPCPRVRVTTPGEVLNIRPAPSTAMAPVGTLPDGTIVEVVATVSGEAIDGIDVWYQITSVHGDGYIFSSFAACTTDPIPEPPDGYYLPFACGFSARITQGPGGGLSHTGRTQYAFDFGVALNTPIHAIADGTVTGVRTATRPGDPCYGGGDSSCGALANWVIVQHADGNTSAYKHLNDSSMTVGTTVRRGDVIGLSGSTGYSTGPHLHLELRGNCPTEIYCQTIPIQFADVGLPASGTTVTSGNCP